MRLFFLILLFFVTTLHAETLKLVTGEYAPYSGAKLKEGGISTQVVKASFEEIKQDVSIEFIPWNRAMNNLKALTASGSFPWVKNKEREDLLLFSDPIHKYKLTSFVRKNSKLLTSFNLDGVKICQPNGWDISFLNATIATGKVTVERPINIDSCFQMLVLGRVDLVVLNNRVGNDFINMYYPKDSPIVGIDNDYFGKEYALYFIISKKYPNAKKIISDFNRGLAIIKANGKYDSYVHNLLIKKEAIKSICESCNRLGSL